MGHQLAIRDMSREEFDELLEAGRLSIFRYTPNSRGFIFLQICAALLFVIGFVVYLITGFDPTYWIVLSAVLAVTGASLLVLVVYWSLYARISLVAFDDDYLYVASMRRVSLIPWRELSAENAGFGDEHPDGNHGTLNIRIGEGRVSLRLFNPFVWIEDFPTFLVELLSQIKSNSPPRAEGTEADG